MCFECRVIGALVSVSDQLINSDVFHAEEPQQQQLSEARGISLHACAALSYHPTLEQVDAARDDSAESYLADTLAHLSSRGLHLVPIKVDSDGSCMPHAVSRSMVGKEVLFNVLRHALQRELIKHAQWYKNKFQQGMDDDTWNVHWNSICDEAAPTAGRASGRWLGPGEHLVGLANVLCRPILLLDRLDLMQSRDDHSCGMFLPLRLGSSTSMSAGESGSSGEVCAGPLVIGWANASHNHFVSLMAPDWRNEITQRPHTVFFPHHADALLNECIIRHAKLWNDIKEVLGLSSVAAVDVVDDFSSALAGAVSARPKVRMVVPPGRGPGDVCMVKDSATGNEVAIQVPVGKMEGDEFFWTPPVAQLTGAAAAGGRSGRRGGRGGGKGGSSPKVELLVALTELFLRNWQVQAGQGKKEGKLRLKQSCAVLVQVLSNLVDALTGVFDKFEKHRKLKLSNKTVVRSVVQVAGARKVLEAVGMTEKTLPDDGMQYLYFIHDQPTSQVADALVIAKRAVELMRDACSNGEVTEAEEEEEGVGELFPCDFIVKEGEEALLFGATPVLCDLTWEQARQQYGETRTNVDELVSNKNSSNNSSSNNNTIAQQHNNESRTENDCSDNILGCSSSPSEQFVIGRRNSTLTSMAEQELAFFYIAGRAAYESAVRQEAPEFGNFPWDDAVQYSQRVGSARCKACGVEQMWRTDIDSLLSEARMQRCHACEGDVTVAMTGQRRIEEFVYDWTQAQRMKLQQHQQQQQQQQELQSSQTSNNEESN